ncbi:MAG: hypothetical protein HKO93_04020, partial [Flavobacteriales bacterium]|nr:hypothetical protein [Flavobacteriales bacterium]
MIRALLLIALCFSPEQSQAQEYFQQRVDYEIDVTLNDETHVLDGFITMEYHNNSPQALDSIIIHLWPNAYSSRSTELGRQLRERGDFKLEFSEEYERGEISGLKFNIDDRPIAYKQLKGLVDVAVLELEEPLLSGNSIRISTPF